MTTSGAVQTQGRASMIPPGSWLAWRLPHCSTTADHIYRSAQLAHSLIAVFSTLFVKGRGKERGV